MSNLVSTNIHETFLNLTPLVLDDPGTQWISEVGVPNMANKGKK